MKRSAVLVLNAFAWCGDFGSFSLVWIRKGRDIEYMSAKTCIQFHIFTSNMHKYFERDKFQVGLFLVHVTHLAALPFYSGSNLILFERYEVLHIRARTHTRNMQVISETMTLWKYIDFVTRTSFWAHAQPLLLTNMIYYYSHIICLWTVLFYTAHRGKKKTTAELKINGLCLPFCSSESIKCYFSRKQWRPFLCLDQCTCFTHSTLVSSPTHQNRAAHWEPYSTISVKLWICFCRSKFVWHREMIPKSWSWKDQKKKQLGTNFSYTFWWWRWCWKRKLGAQSFCMHNFAHFRRWVVMSAKCMRTFPLTRPIPNVCALGM